MKTKKLTVKQIEAEISVLEKTMEEQRVKQQEYELKFREQGCKAEKTLTAIQCLRQYIRNIN